MCESIELPNNWSMISGLARRIRVAVESHSPAQVSHAKLNCSEIFMKKRSCLKFAPRTVVLIHIIFLGHLSKCEMGLFSAH
jgi:hypothetical protein